MIRTARDFVADVGEEAASKSGHIVSLARRNPKNGERDCERLMSKRLGLTIPVRKSFLKTKDDSLQIPYMRVQDWISFLLEHNCMHILAGLVRPNEQREGDIWQRFWELYEKQCPQHPIFARARAGEVCLRRCVAVLVHGDEGRSKKRLPFLVVNAHSPLGRGVDCGLKSGETKRRYLKMLPNFKGHSYTSRFMLCAISKAGYTGKNAHVFDLMLKTVGKDLARIAETGVQDRSGQGWWAFCLGVVGDWPFLAKCGLERSFHNVPKHKGPDGAARRVCRGICHLCNAGMPHVDYEQINTSQPQWGATLLQDSPFNGPNPLERIPHAQGELATLFRFDLFHCWHLGVSKNYLGSMLCLLADQEAASTVDARFEMMTQSYISWCAANRKQPHTKKISKDHVSWSKGYPTGTWHKGELSTSLMLWVEARFLAESAEWSGKEPMLVKAGEAGVAINTALRLLSASDAWIPAPQAKLIAQYGLRFLRRYASLAQDAHARNLRHWLIMPKAHAVHHLFLGLLWDSERGPAAMNPLLFSVQMDEDFIGRGSRLSRHVHTARVEDRVVTRYLQAMYHEYVEARYLIRAKSWTF